MFSSQARQGAHGGKGTLGGELLQALGGEDAGDTGEIVGDTYVGPNRAVEERPNGGQAFVPKFEHKQPTPLQFFSGLWGQLRGKLVAPPAAAEGGFLLLFVH